MPQTKNKKTKSTIDELIESLSPEQLKEFEEGYKAFVLEELALALQEGDEASVRQLARIAGASPAKVQEMRAGLKKTKTRAKPKKPALK